MPDPITLGVLGGWVASEGIKFLYGQAAELLKAWRERRRQMDAGTHLPSQLTVPIIATEVLDATPVEACVDVTVLEKEEKAMTMLLGQLGLYVGHESDFDLHDAELADQAGQLRALLEAAYGQRFTFRGEQRDPTGTRVSVTQVIDDVSGDVVGMNADVAPGASADIHQQAKVVQRGGSMTGYDGTVGR